MTSKVGAEIICLLPPERQLSVTVLLYIFPAGAKFPHASLESERQLSCGKRAPTNSHKSKASFVVLDSPVLLLALKGFNVPKQFGCG